MCGIIAAATEKSVGKLLVQGLYKMEYRGYDSAGVALHQTDDIAHLRSLGKVKKLESKMAKEKPKKSLRAKLALPIRGGLPMANLQKKTPIHTFLIIGCLSCITASLKIMLP